MALSFSPPFTPIIRISIFSNTFKRILPKTQLELALSLCISAPECPPVKPSNLISIILAFIISLLYGRIHVAVAPPAQLTVNIPSSSESTFKRSFPFKSETSIAAAPNIPTSSSTVNTASIGGCAISLLSKIARA